MPPAIRVENLSKCYHIGHASQRPAYRTLRESLMELATAPLRRWRGGAAGRPQEFWALKGIDFEVQPGEIVGVIGRNGAGKSTLLKILSRITEPTHGRVRLRGRVGSLLEVGTGFHQELTGRENIFMNGSILGMSRSEIVRRFNEIVEFAEIGMYLDTPVKRYSSGMYVRLAFAVAAHLQPEILIIDEVLAVGDAAFQLKCLAKINSVATSGRTVILVSHQMETVQRICRSVVVLKTGRVSFQGPAPEGVNQYLEDNRSAQHAGKVQLAPKERGRQCDFLGLELLNSKGERSPFIRFGEPFTIRLTAECYERIPDAVVGIEIITSTGSSLLMTQSEDFSGERYNILDGNHVFECSIHENLLMPGNYMIGIHVLDRNWICLAEAKRALEFEIVNVSDNHLSVTTNRPGRIIKLYPWSMRDPE